MTVPVPGLGALCVRRAEDSEGRAGGLLGFGPQKRRSPRGARLPAQARWPGVGGGGASPAWRPRWEGASGSWSLLAALPSPSLSGNSGRVALEPANPLKSLRRLPQAAGG